jgi:hypothetical protein
MPITLSRLGQINATGNDRAGFQTVFETEVLTAFETVNVMRDKHLVRRITSGKSARFPATWKAVADYLTPGNEISPLAIKHGERVINVDGLLVASAVIYDLDEAMNNFDVRSIYTAELGRALAVLYDKQVLISAVLAARAAATISGGYGGSAVTSATIGSDSSVLAAALFTAAQTLDEKDVGEDMRFCILKPAQFYLLAQNTNVINKDWGGAGAYSDGKVLRVAGIEIVKSNNLPTTTITSSPAGAHNTYHGDFSVTRGVVMKREAVGTVELLDLSTEMGRRIEYQGDQMVARMAVGHGILRPECAVELRTGTPA